MLSPFTTYIRSCSGPNAHFIAACSGGVDSVVLCALCHEAGLSFSIAHCNFTLRGAESERDETFVRGLAEKYGTKIHVRRFETESIAADEKLSIQETARRLRYEWFSGLRQQEQAAYVLLAHHADDSIESSVMHFFRGTGLHGLTGIPPASTDKVCLRPLLSFSRADILAFAHAHQLKWVEDSSNSSNKYTRNFFRNELLPAIEKVYPQVRENLADNIERFGMIRRFYDAAVADLKKKLVKKEKETDAIPVLKLLQFIDSSFLYEWLKDYGFGEKQLPDLVRLLHAETGKYMESVSHRIVRNRKWLLVIPKNEVADAAVLIDKNMKTVSFAGGTLDVKTLEAKGYNIKRSPATAQLDMNEVSFPLLLRRWKQGDYFYPLGLGKKKKLSRFFIDRKLSLADKEAIWVLQSGEKIIWVVGHQIDHRFRITDKTENILVINLSSP